MLMTSDVNTITVNIQERFQHQTDYSFRFVKLDSLNYNVHDRGANYDFHTATVKVVADETMIDAIINFINDTARDIDYAVELTLNDSEKLFGENIDYTSAIPCTIADVSLKQNRTKGSFELDITFNAKTAFLTYTGTSGWAGLTCLQYGYESDRTWEYTVNTSYLTGNYISDSRSDAGIFKGSYIIDAEILRNLLEWRRINRGTTMSLTAAQVGIDELFGPKSGVGPWDVKVLSLKWEFWSITRYKLTLELREVL